MPDNRNPLTRHLFGLGTSCPTKLYYKAHAKSYPERHELLPFLEHVGYNKRQLKGLLKAQYPGAVSVEINDSDLERAYQETDRHLQPPHAAVIDAAFLNDGLFAKIPLLEKDGKYLRIYQIQTRAFDPQRHSLIGRNGKIHSKWKDYLRDFAYSVHVVRRCYPDWKVDPYLVLPDKTEKAKIDRIDQKLAGGEPLGKEQVSNLLAFLPVREYLERFWDGRETLIEREEHPLYGRPFSECLEVMADWYSEGRKIFTGVGNKCRNCEFRVEMERLEGGEKSGFRECWSNVLSGESIEEHVFDLIGAGNRELVDREIYLQEEVSIESGLEPEQIDKN
ncbi:MAG: hypothetical protein R3224_07025, partial [Balneolaceae bacterium]|nr:hypothetical protein [Balneolaceae bacterium]